MESRMRESVKLIECPRDAWQGLKGQIPREIKIDYLQALISAGFKESSNADYLNGTAGTNVKIEFVDGAGAKTNTATQGYCLSATAASGNTFAYNSALGGLQPGTGATCP